MMICDMVMAMVKAITIPQRRTPSTQAEPGVAFLPLRFEPTMVMKMMRQRTPPPAICCILQTAQCLVKMSMDLGREQLFDLVRSRVLACLLRVLA